MPANPANLPVILSIDDNDIDGALLERAFKRTGVAARLFRVSEGSQALAYLSGEGIYADRENYPLPDSVLLDLAMPKMSGFDVLNWIRQHPDINKTTVLILTSSERPEDKKAASKIGADEYFVKPNKFEDLKLLVKTIESDWLHRKTEKSKTAAGAKKSVNPDSSVTTPTANSLRADPFIYDLRSLIPRGLLIGNQIRVLMAACRLSIFQSFLTQKVGRFPSLRRHCKRARRR